MLSEVLHVPQVKVESSHWSDGDSLDGVATGASTDSLGQSVGSSKDVTEGSDGDDCELHASFRSSSESEGGRHHELDHVMIFEREQAHALASNYVASTQNIEHVVWSLNPLDEARMVIEEEPYSPNRSASRVVFSHASIREYPVIPGCNHATSVGPPVTIDWEYLTHAPMDIDQYESGRENLRRGLGELRMPESARVDLLKRNGFLKPAIVTASREANRHRSRDMRAACRRQHDGCDELVEKAARKLQNILSMGRMKRKERSYLQANLINRSPPHEVSSSPLVSILKRGTVD
jgi:hypothetical protein